MPTTREIVTVAKDRKTGMTVAEIVEALGDFADGVVPIISVGFRGQVQSIKVRTQDPPTR